MMGKTVVGMGKCLPLLLHRSCCRTSPSLTRTSVCINTRAIARLHVNALVIFEMKHMSMLAACVQ
jgi:hypothetical protein